MPPVAATGLEPNGSERDIQLILNNDDSVNGDLCVVCGSLNGTARLIHVAARPEQHDSLITQPSISSVCVRPTVLFEPDAKPTGKLINNEIAHVVPSCGVLLARIPKPDDEPHRQEN